MHTDKTDSEFGAIRNRVLAQIGHCLRRGCVICIEHAPALAPRSTLWEVWGRPCCYDGNVQGIYDEIDLCRTTHGDHHIRLNIEDHKCFSRFSLMVHNPPAAAVA